MLPKPTAFPRPQLPDTTLVTIADAPLSFKVNSEAAVSSPRAGWYDVSYPTLGATIHLTFTESTSEGIDEVKANRMQRLLLNSGEATTDFSEFRNDAGFDIAIARTEATATPIQFLATDNERWVVSGVVYFSSPRAPFAVDSLRPMVKAIDKDMVRALSSLSYK